MMRTSILILCSTMVLNACAQPVEQKKHAKKI